MSKLKSKAEKKAQNATTLSFCKTMSLIHIKDAVEEMLSLIRNNGLFEEYTLHNISHIDKMLSIVDWLIPEKTKKVMTTAEWLMLTLSVYFHDMGMLVSKTEYEQREKSPFKEHKEQISKSDEEEYKKYSEDNDKSLYQDFVRENHAKRIRKWIDGKNDITLGAAEEQQKIINGILSGLDEKFRSDLAMICESHHKDNLDDFNIYKTNAQYGDDPDEKVNLNYIAIILRCADLLHITNDRTPSISRRIINVSNPKSVLEWEKQQAVRAVTPVPSRNADGNVDASLGKDTIAVTAYFNGAETAEAYFGLSSYLQYTQKELERCNAIVLKAQKNEGTGNYEFPWKKIDDSAVEVVGFEKKKLQFYLDQEKILQLLVGHTLYNDSSVVIRELTQNAIDAVKLQKSIEQRQQINSQNGEVLIQWNEESRILSVTDNGTGMTMNDIENYLLKVGASKYRSEDFMKEFPNFPAISRFGIGILTCFMVSNSVDITTSSVEDSDANIIKLRGVQGTYLLMKKNKDEIDPHIKSHGTQINLCIRQGIDMASLERDLRRWIVVPGVPVYLIENGQKLQISSDSLKQVLVDHFKRRNIVIDDKEYSVFEHTEGDVSVACLLRHNKYLSDWALFPVRTTSESELLPIGTCVEGIRVEFNTPGYNNLNFYAIANIKNSKFKTNVARSALEYDANNQILRDLYLCYKYYLEAQIRTLQSNNFSVAWALNENDYLMQPLISQEDRASVPIDNNLLMQCLAELKCLIVENGGVRTTISANEIDKLAEVNTIESRMTYSIENLLAEIKSETTMSTIIETVCGGENEITKGLKSLLCNYNHYNILHRYSLRNKQPEEIYVDRSRRLIRLTYTNKNTIWKKIAISKQDNKYLYLPQKDFHIKGLIDEVGIRTDSGIYLNGGTPFCEYIRKIINTVLQPDTAENRRLLGGFLARIFSVSILERKIHISKDTELERFFDNRFDVSDFGDVSPIWNKIDINEFKTMIMSSEYTLFSIYNFIRPKKV